MQPIENYKDAHKGETCAVLGGGTSLPLDLRQIDPVDVFIGVNQHSMILPVDYVVFSDRHMWDIIKQIPDCLFFTHSTRFNYPNVIHGGAAPSMGYSGQRAIWLADYLGFDRIDVCGMDQYDPEDHREYWWEGPQIEKMQKHTHCQSDLSRLKNFIDTLQHPERIHFVSGRLKETHQ